MLGLDAERGCERLHDVVRRHGTVAVHEVVEVARRELRLVGKGAIGDAGLVHQLLDGRPEWLLAEPSLARRH